MKYVEVICRGRMTTPSQFRVQLDLSEGYTIKTWIENGRRSEKVPRTCCGWAVNKMTARRDRVRTKIEDGKNNIRKPGVESGRYANVNVT